MSAALSRLSTRDLLCALLVILLWGMNFVPTKIALEAFTPMQLGSARFLLAALPLVLVVSLPRIPLRWLLFYTLTQGVGQFGLLFFALKLGMSASLASVLMQTQVFFTALLGATLLGEVIPRSLKVGMAIAAAGLLCFAATAIRGGPGVTVVGFGFTLAAATMWAGSNIVVKQIQRAGHSCSPLSLVAWSSLVSALAFAVLSINFDDPAARFRWLDAPPATWLAVVYLGWIGNAFTVWLWTTLLNRYPASQIAPFTLGIPIVGVLSGILLLGESVSGLQWAGSALIMSAIVLVVFSSRRYLERMAQRYRRGR